MTDDDLNKLVHKIIPDATIFVEEWEHVLDLRSRARANLTNALSAERERCAKIVETFGLGKTVTAIAAEIRSGKS